MTCTNSPGHNATLTPVEAIAALPSASLQDEARAALAPGAPIEGDAVDDLEFDWDGTGALFGVPRRRAVRLHGARRGRALPALWRWGLPRLPVALRASQLADLMVGRGSFRQAGLERASSWSPLTESAPPGLSVSWRELAVGGARGVSNSPSSSRCRIGPRHAHALRPASTCDTWSMLENFTVEVGWSEQRASRLPEALWGGFDAPTADSRIALSVIGRSTDAHRVVDRTGRRTHAADAVTRSAGQVVISPDTARASLGEAPADPGRSSALEPGASAYFGVFNNLWAPTSRCGSRGRDRRRSASRGSERRHERGPNSPGAPEGAWEGIPVSSPSPGGGDRRAGGRLASRHR